MGLSPTNLVTKLKHVFLPASRALCIDVIAAALLCFAPQVLLAAQSATFPPAKDIAGSWQGVFQCDGYTTEFSLKLSATDDGGLTGSMNRTILGPNFKKFQHPYEKSLSLNGRYDATTATFALGSGQGRHQEIVFQGIINPSGDRMTGSVKSSQGRACSSVVLGKGFGREVSQIIARATPSLYRPKVDARASCDAKVVDWISHPFRYEQYAYQMRNAGGYASLALFEDARFKPAFGKSFFNMSKKELTKLENQIARACWGQIHAIGGHAKTATGVLSVVRQQPGQRLNAAIHPYSRDVARVWQHAAVAAANLENQRQIAQLSNAAHTMTQVLWPYGEYNFSAQLADRRSAAGTQRMMSALDALLEPSSPTFEMLEQLALFERRVVVGGTGAVPLAPGTANRRQAIAAARAQQRASYAEAAAEFVVTEAAMTDARKRLSGYLNKHVVSAAQQYALQQVTPKDVRQNLISLAARNGSELNKYVLREAAAQTDAIFKKQRDAQAAQFAKAETQNYAQFKQSVSDTLGGLQQLNQYHSALQGQYGELLNLKPFSTLQQTTAKDRQSLLSLLQPMIIGQVQQAQTVSAMEGLVERSVIADDRQSRAYLPISRAIEQKRAELAPFTGYPGAEYLNAIYAGDTRALDTADREYRRRLNQSVRDFMGGGGGFMQNLTHMVINEIRIIEPVMATYLLNYEKNYSRCLRSDAATFTVTTTVPTTVTTNLLGVEMARSEGYTISDDFKVNKEFEATFRRVGTMKPSGFMASLVDKYLSNGGIGAATGGVRKMMRSMDCNSAVVERMEDRMREAFYR